MDLISLILVGVGLSLDALAVTLAIGIFLKKVKLYHAFILGFSFGFFQFFMPLLGYYAGFFLEKYISFFDHWVAFLLLAYIGGKMIYESVFCKDVCKESPFTFKKMLILSFATSIDALCVGFSFALIGVKDILFSSTIIGLTTFLVCFFGIFILNCFNKNFGKKAGLFGGIILFLIGLKILLEHLFFN